jgi:F0F1-type ATP synthase membrane subunit b/b'
MIDNIGMVQTTIDPSCWTIISALVAAILGMAWFIKSLYKNLQECQSARAKFVEDQLSLARAAKDEAGPKGGGL